MKFKLWPVMIIFIYALFICANFTMVWIAKRNPPIMVEKVNEWK
jgi:hypothetical protein